MTAGEALASIAFGLLIAVLLTAALGASAGSIIMDSIPKEPDCSMSHIINLTDCPDVAP